MSDAMKKVRDVRTLPIFPLPVILFPGEMIPLHIFEPRYRKMLADIQAGDKLFGLSYFEAPDMETARPPAGHLGCAAELREVQEMPDGRSNIVITGVVRYRMEEYVDAGEPYFVGETTFFEDLEEENDESVSKLSGEVGTLFTRVANAAHKISGESSKLPDLPDIAPQELSFLISAAFNFANEIKYELMETRSTTERLERLKDVLEQAVERVEETANIHKISKTNGHSKKKIDLDL